MTHEKNIKKFYAALKKEGMTKLMSKKRHTGYLNFVKRQVKKGQRILDLACGYGRVSIPLAQAGYTVAGIDLSTNLIKDAKKLAKEKKVYIDFRVGNMLHLPYVPNSFDVIICLWSSFNHLLTQKDQVQALQEMNKVLKNGGSAIIDMPTNKVLRNKHKVTNTFEGNKNTNYVHNRKSLITILKKAKISNYKISIEDIGARKRLILYLRKY